MIVAPLQSSHPDSSARFSIIEHYVFEASLRPEPYGPWVCAVDAYVRALNPHSRNTRHPFLTQRRSCAVPLYSLQEIKMDVRWITLNDLLRGTQRMMKGKCSAFVRRPLGWWPSARIGILSSQRRPPLVFETLEPSFCVGRANGKTGNSVPIFDDKCEMRFEKSIRSRIDVTDQLAVTVKVRSVSSLMAGRKGDGIESAQIGGLKGSDFEHKTCQVRPRVAAASRRPRSSPRSAGA